MSVIWDSYFGERTIALNRCLEAANEKHDDPNPMTEARCREYYRGSYDYKGTENWFKTIGIALLPAIVYAIGRVWAWVVSGFRSG